MLQVALAALITILVMTALTVIMTQRASAATFACSAESTDSGFDVSWSGAPASTSKFRIERNVAGTFYWRGAATPPATTFTDTSSSTGTAQYRVKALGSWPTVLDQVDCTDGPGPDPEPCSSAARVAGDRTSSSFDMTQVPDGSFLLRGSQGQFGTPTLVRYDPTSGEDSEILSPEGEALNILSPVISHPDGRAYVTAVTDNSRPLFAVDLGNRTTTRANLSPANGWRHSLLGDGLGSDGRIYLSARFGARPYNYGIIAYDPSTNRAVRILEGLNSQPEGIAMTPGRVYYNATALVNGALVRTISYYDIASGTHIATSIPEFSVLGQADVVASDGRFYFSSVGGGSQVYDPATDELSPTPFLGFSPLEGPDGLLYGGYRGVVVYDPATNEATTIPVPGSTFVRNPVLYDGDIHVTAGIGDTVGIYRLDLATRTISTVLDDLDSRNGATPFLAVDDTGRFYLRGDLNDGLFTTIVAVDPNC